MTDQDIRLAAAALGRRGGAANSAAQTASRKATVSKATAARRGKFAAGHKHRAREAGGTLCACGAVRTVRGEWRGGI